MAQIWTVWDAELGYSPMHFIKRDVDRTNPQGAEPLWGVATVRPDGGRILHTFPHSTLEWRAAEYGIDPADSDTLLDVILHEPYLPNEDDPLAQIDPATSKLLAEVRGLPTCWTPGVPDAERLQAHLARMQAVKRHRVRLENAPSADRQAALVYVGSDRVAPPHPLDPIRAARLDPIRVESRRMAVKWQRQTGQKPDFFAKPATAFMGMQPTGGAV
ncbi:hypothetical protein ACFLIM_39270 [Nonomuraea sp. M3C6]|uniref:Uncharacterized protein n=1 Tax=Nonomuraea marmarensis TaxID=3351344 RepID=A0ABW7APC0_9ACTN